MQYLLARAYLDNKAKVAVKIPAVTKANADDIVIKQKQVSNDMRFMNANYNIAGEATHTPVDKQVFLISAALSATVDVGSLAKAFNLEYNQFIGQSIMVDGFGFDVEKLKRLDHIMSITAEQGLIPNYTKFTEQELASLEMVQGAIMDKNFLVIYDRLVEMRDVIDARHLNVNSFLHLWKIFSYNVFAQVRFFTTEDVTPTPPEPTEITITTDKDIVALEVGGDPQTVNITHSLLPEDATVVVESADEDTATVSFLQNFFGGVATVTPVAAGTTYMYIKIYNGRVIDPEDESVELLASKYIPVEVSEGE